MLCWLEPNKEGSSPGTGGWTTLLVERGGRARETFVTVQICQHNSVWATGLSCLQQSQKLTCSCFPLFLFHSRESQSLFPRSTSARDGRLQAGRCRGVLWDGRGAWQVFNVFPSLTKHTHIWQPLLTVSTFSDPDHPLTLVVLLGST